MNWYTVEIKDDKGNVVGTLRAYAKTFKTGSKGFYASGKVELTTGRHQVGMNIIQIGSKPTA